MFTHFFHFNVHLARDFQIEVFMQFGALLVASSDRNLRDFERFSGLGQTMTKSQPNQLLQPARRAVSVCPRIRGPFVCSFRGLIACVLSWVEIFLIQVGSTSVFHFQSSAKVLDKS